MKKNGMIFLSAFIGIVFLSCSGGGSEKPLTDDPTAASESSAATYSVSYNVNGGSGYELTDATKYRRGETVTVVNNKNSGETEILSKSDEIFSGWEYDGEVYQPGSAVRIYSNITFTARWLPPTVGLGNSSGTLTGSIPGGTTVLVLPEGVTDVPANAFDTDPGITGITELIIADGVETIGDSAFAGAVSLADIKLPDSLTSIGDNAFAGTAVTTLIVPDGVETIGVSAFDGVSSLTELALPDTLTTIGDFAFTDAAITSLVIPEGVTTIGVAAFEDNASLESVQLPSTLTELGDDPLFPGATFSGAASLTTVTFHADTSGMTKIHPYTFNGAEKLTTINNLPDTINEIGSNAFRNTKMLTSFDLPDSLQTIGSRAFEGSGLTTLTIPASVTYIESRAFHSNTSLMSVDFSALIIADSVTIGSNAFEDCQLTTLTLPDAINNISFGAFLGNPLTLVRVERINAPITDDSGSADELFDNPIAVLQLPAGYNSASYTDSNSSDTWDNFTTINTY